MSIACVVHYCGNVRKVKVDKSGNVDKLGDTLNTAAKNVVGNLKRVSESNAGIGYLLKSLVGDNYKSVNVLTELGDTLVRLNHSSLTLKAEGLGYDSNGKDTHILCYASNYGSCARTCSTAHTRGNEHHVRANEHFLDFLYRLFSRTRADFGICTCAEALCDLFTDNYLVCRRRLVEHLNIGIYRDKLNSLDFCGNHSFNGVISAAAYTNDFNINSTLEAVVEFSYHLNILHFKFIIYICTISYM